MPRRRHESSRRGDWRHHRERCDAPLDDFPEYEQRGLGGFGVEDAGLVLTNEVRSAIANYC